MKEKTNQKKIAYVILSGFLTACAVLVAFAINGMYPFSNGTIAALDLNTQYLPLLYRFYDVITNGKHFSVEFHIGGGMNLFSDTFTEIANPFNYVLLLFGRDALYRGVNILLLLYCTAASVTATFSLNKLFEENANLPLNLVFGICYGLSFYNAYQYEIIRWMLLVVLFPLFVLGLKSLLYDKKALVYTLILSYVLALSLQFGIQLCLFSLSASIFYMLMHQKNHKDSKSERANTAFCLVLATISAVLISCINTVPSAVNILKSARSAQNDSLLSVITRHGLDDLPERLLEISSPLVWGILIGILILFRKEIKSVWKEVKYLAFFVLFLIMTVILQPSNLLWHLGSYQCFPVRYGYMVLFMTQVLTLSLLNRSAYLREKSAKTLRFRDIIILITSVIINAAVFAYIVGNRLSFAQAFATLSITSMCFGTLMILYGLLLAFALCACVLVLIMEKPAARVVLIFSSVLLGISMLLCVLWPQDFLARAYIEADFANMAAGVSIEDSQRHIKDEESYGLNAPLITSEYSLTAYMPSGEDKRYVAAMDTLGYVTPWVSVRSEGGTVISDALLGFDERLEGGISISDDAYGYISKYEKDTSDNPIIVQKNLLAALCYDTPFEYKNILKVIHTQNSSQIPSISTEGTQKVYVSFKTPISNIYVNDNPVASVGAEYRENPEAIWYLGEFESDEVKICATDFENVPINNIEAYIAIIDCEEFDNLVDYLSSENDRTVVYDDHGASIKITCNDGVLSSNLLLPTAFFDGASCEGAQVTAFFKGLMKLEMTDSVTEALIQFRTPVIFKGLLLSVLGVIILVLLVFIGIGGRIADKISYVIYIPVCVLFLIMVYVLPNIGMAGYMAGRLLGYDLYGQLNKVLLSDVNDNKSECVLLGVEENENGIDLMLAKNNLILSKKARMSADSSENKELGPKNAGDGNSEYSSRWSSVNNTQDAYHYLQADLQEECSVKAVRILWAQSNVKRYALLYSEDGVNFKEAASFDESPNTLEQIVSFEESIPLRYLRLESYEVNRNEQDLSLYYQNIAVNELEVYGDDCVKMHIAKPSLDSGYDRGVPMPEVTLTDAPEKFDYSLEIGGCDYNNVITDENEFIDTYSPIDIELGYELKIDGDTFELPGFSVTLPASDNAPKEEFPWGDFEVCEWKPNLSKLRLEELSSNPSVFDAFVTKTVNPNLESTLGTEGYVIDIEKTGISLSAATCEGMVWGERTLSRIKDDAFGNSREYIPCGVIRDYPKYEVRGFMIDVGRRPVSIDFLYCLVNVMSEYRMNTLQIHLNDNAIISESGYDGTYEGAMDLYSGFRLESSYTGEKDGKLYDSDCYYTKEEFAQLIEYAQSVGVSIVPEIDTPAHSLSITKLSPSLGYSDPAMADTLDISLPQAREAVYDIFEEYLVGEGDESATFKNCDTIHIGMDEYFGRTNDYVFYLNSLYKVLKDFDPSKKLRMWGSLSYLDANLAQIPHDIEIMVWNPLWADPKEMFEDGFSIINCLNRNLYIIVGGGTDYLNNEYLANEWEPNRFVDEDYCFEAPAWSKKMLGAVYAMWNDNYTKGTDTTDEDELLDRVLSPIGIISDKLW